MVGATVSHYKILAKLGEGGMGVVYKAHDTKLDRLVALKFLPRELLCDPDAKRRFVHEARAACTLQHNNICTVHDIDETDDGQMFIVMDLYDGETLKKKIERGPLKIDEAIDIALQVGQGLAKAHEHGIVHRDIKPANVMITSDGVAKVVDFGLAKLSGRTMLTMTGSPLGTADYMSPEQARGGPVDHRTDIWSLGVLIYEMITGQRPFRSEYQEAVLYSILNENPEPVTSLRSGIPSNLEHTVQKCLEKDPADRYQHVLDLLVDLRHLVKEPHQRGMRSASAGAAARRQLPKSTGIVLALSVLVAASAAIWFLELNRGPSTGSPGESSIAVLPFTSISKGPDDEIFAEGFHDHLLSQLHGIHGFRVIARQSVIQYKQSQKRSRDIAQELGVAMLMEGSVLRAGNTVRVEAQLIDGKTEGHIWSHTYDGDFRDIFRVQAEIAQQIALSLRTALRSDEKDAIERPLTNNKTAYEYYLKGNHFWENYETFEGNDTAIAMYERAAKEDPGFLQAHAMIALGCFGNANRLNRWEVQRAQLVRKGEIALERATSLDPDNWMVLHARAMLHEIRNENEQALSLLQKTLDKQPTNAEILEDLGYLLLGMRRFEEALPFFMKQYELNPKGLNSGIWVGFTYWKMHRWNDALKWLDLIIAQKPEYAWGYARKADVLIDGFGKLDETRSVLDEGLLRVKDSFYWHQLLLEKFHWTFTARDFAGALAILAGKEWEGPGDFRLIQMGHIYRMMGMEQEARKYYVLAADTLKELLNQRPDDPFLHVQLGLAYAGLHRTEESFREGQRAVELPPDSRLHGEVVHVEFVHLNVMLGKYDAAITELDKLLSIPGGIVTVWRLKLDPWCDPLRNNLRFQALLAKED